MCADENQEEVSEGNIEIANGDNDVGTLCSAYVLTPLVM